MEKVKLMKQTFVGCKDKMIVKLILLEESGQTKSRI